MVKEEEHGIGDREAGVWIFSDNPKWQAYFRGQDCSRKRGWGRGIRRVHGYLIKN